MKASRLEPPAKIRQQTAPESKQLKVRNLCVDLCVCECVVGSDVPRL